MRWRTKGKLPHGAEPGDRHLFLHRPRWWPRFLDCGCVVTRRPYLETYKFGHTAFEEMMSGMSFRPHRWGRKTICVQCMRRTADDNSQDLRAFLVHEEEFGAVFHGDILGAFEFEPCE